VTDLTAESAAPVLRAIQRLAAGHGWDPVPLLRDDLIAALADPQDSFAMSVEQAVATATRILGPAGAGPCAGDTS